MALLNETDQPLEDRTVVVYMSSGLSTCLSMELLVASVRKSENGVPRFLAELVLQSHPNPSPMIQAIAAMLGNEPAG